MHIYFIKVKMTLNVKLLLFISFSMQLGTGVSYFILAPQEVAT